MRSNGLLLVLYCAQSVRRPAVKFLKEACRSWSIGSGKFPGGNLSYLSLPLRGSESTSLGSAS